MQNLSEEEFDRRKVLKETHHHHDPDQTHQQLRRSRRKATFDRLQQSKGNGDDVDQYSASYEFSDLKLHQSVTSRVGKQHTNNDGESGEMTKIGLCCTITDRTTTTTIARKIQTDQTHDKRGEFPKHLSTCKKKLKKWSSHKIDNETMFSDKLILSSSTTVVEQHIKPVEANSPPYNPLIVDQSTALISARPTAISLKHQQHNFRRCNDCSEKRRSHCPRYHEFSTIEHCSENHHQHNSTSSSSSSPLSITIGDQRRMSCRRSTDADSMRDTVIVLPKFSNNYCLCIGQNRAFNLPASWMSRATAAASTFINGLISVIMGLNHHHHQHHSIFSKTNNASTASCRKYISSINAFNVVLFLVVLLNFTRLACGHNVNLESSNINSDRLLSTIHQQHSLHIINHDDNHDGGHHAEMDRTNKNNIRRDLSMNSPQTNLAANTDMDTTSTSKDILKAIDTNPNDRRGEMDGEDSTSTSTVFERPSSSGGGCQSCRMHEQVKAENLASIKRHILYRLKLTVMPNITAPVAVPQHIIDDFYKKHRNPGHGIVGSERSSSRSDGGGSNVYYENRFGGGARDSNANNGERRYATYDDDDGEMQGDDPRAFYSANGGGGGDVMRDGGADSRYGEYQQRLSHNHYSQVTNGNGEDDGGEMDDGDDEEYEDGFFSVVNSIYVFPTAQRTRHNRKNDILHFRVTNTDQSIVSRATLNLFVRSWKWVREHSATIDAPIPVLGQSSSSGGSSTASAAGTTTTTSNSGASAATASGAATASSSNRNVDIVFRVNRVLRHANMTHTRKGNDIRHRIPRNNNGVWIQVDITDMVSDWYKNASANHGVVIKTKEPWMKHLIVVDDSLANKTYTPHIEVITKRNRKRRTKRNTSLNCSEADNETRCCRYPLEVNFRHFSWDWVIAPEKFDAYFCKGECKLGFLQKYPHTHMVQMSTAPQQCCSPTKMSPVTLLYFNTEHHLVMSTIPNMAVDTCSCS